MANRMTALQFLARELRCAREAAGMSQAQLATAVGCYSTSFVAMVETCRRIPKPDFTERCDQALRTGGFLSRLLDDLVTDGMPPEWLRKWRGIQDEATSLLVYQPLVVPGLLQTEAYAREIIAGSGRGFNADELVSARLERQQLLAGDDPPMFVVIWDEAFLRRPVGGSAVMCAQVTHLMNAVERPRIMIQVVPLGAGAYAGLAGPLEIAVCAGKEVAYVDHTMSGEIFERAEDVAVLTRVWESLRSEALPKRQSVDLMAEIAKSWT